MFFYTFIYRQFQVHVFYIICRKHPVKMSFVRVRRSNSAGIPRKQKTHKKKPVWDVSEACILYNILKEFCIFENCLCKKFH